MIKACKTSPVESRQEKKSELGRCVKSSVMAVIITSNSTNMCSMMVHGAPLVRIKGEGMTQLNGELVHVACFPQEILSTPPAKAAGKKIASRCTELPLCSAGWNNTDRTGRHTPLLVSKIPESREMWERNLLAGSPLLLSCLLE